MPVKLMAAVAVPLQTTWLATAFTIGVGLTVIVNVIGVPGQLAPPATKTGVTVIVATTGAPDELVAVNAARSPVPLAARPIEGALFVQLSKQ